MSSKHTPGPWFCEDGDDEWQVWHDAGMACVATVHRGCEPDETGEANAHLIAAAPDLLAALEDLLPYLEDCRMDSEARAAIAKARGKNPSPKQGARTRDDDAKAAIAKARGQ